MINIQQQDTMASIIKDIYISEKSKKGKIIIEEIIIALSFVVEPKDPVGWSKKCIGNFIWSLTGEKI